MTKGCLIRHIASTLTLIFALICGGSAQAFQLQALDEQRVELMDYVVEGRWTVVMFWATDCIPCEEQKPGLEAFHQEFSPDTASIVGVAIDGFEMIDQILEINAHHQPSYPNLVAFNDVYQRQYEELVGKPFRITPTYLIFDQTGQLHGNVYGNLDLDDLAGYIAAQN